jgi:DNA-binding response OmpR family regulator
MAPARVLLVEDDADLAVAIALELRHGGYEVRNEGDGLAALRLAGAWHPDLVLLDLTLPGLDGIDVCRMLRGTTETPILIITARDAVQERVRGLDAGADDYLVKPFSLEELLARMRSIMRRATAGSSTDVVYAGDLRVDAAGRTASYDDRPIDLTRREFDLLEFFLRHRDVALSRERLLAEVWGYDFLGGSNVVDVYVGYVRQKLGAAGAPPLIQTVRGVGYALRPPPP